MEYIYLALGAILIVVGIFVLLQVKRIRERANALFLEAEKNITEDKLTYVASNLYYCLPNIIRIFISEDNFTTIVQRLYDKSRSIAKDILNDGKINGR